MGYLSKLRRNNKHQQSTKILPAYTQPLSMLDLVAHRDLALSLSRSRPPNNTLCISYRTRRSSQFATTNKSPGRKRAAQHSRSSRQNPSAPASNVCINGSANQVRRHPSQSIRQSAHRKGFAGNADQIESRRGKRQCGVERDQARVLYQRGPM